MDKDKDYLNLCNEHHVALPDFQAQFCCRCFQKECVRSQYGKDKFDIRVSTWEERLFSEVPTMSKDDVRYLPIHNVKFFELQPSLGNISTLSAWEDPLPKAENAPKAVQVLETVPPQEVTILEKAENSSVPDVVATPTEQPKRAVPETSVPRNVLLMNAPTQQGKMLNPPPSAVEKAQKKDPWAEKSAPSLPDAPIVVPGAKIKLGGS